MARRFLAALLRYPVLQNWAAATLLMLACYGFIAWYFLNAAEVFMWSTAKTTAWLAGLFGVVAWAAAFHYQKICRDIRQQP